ncbi:MAG: AAA family ATPase [Nitrospirae bacterium]|nr:AAA family ATPase [Nitrospirota bacterium]
MGDWRDFNDAPDQGDVQTIDAAAVRRDLVDRLEATLAYLFPSGTTKGGTFQVGDLQGNKGDSLVVELAGEKRGLWTDFATGEGGDAVALWAGAHGLSAKADFPRVIEGVAGWLGTTPAPHATSRKPPRQPPMDDLGPHTAKWDYLTADGRLICCVYRYDPPGGKTFRPWDATRKRWGDPTPWPLYNQPGITRVDTVVLVEGEKCADALIGAGICATTAMHGAGATAHTNKTDWSPLKGKRVLVWPDKDAVGWEYAESIASAGARAGAHSMAILLPPEGKPEKWDAADAVAEGFDCAGFIASGERKVIQEAPPVLPTFTLGALLDDDSPCPPDLIGPRVLTPGGLLVFGGAPKVGKSDFLLAWLTHMAAGAAFLGMTPPRPLRVFYLQAEVQYHYLRERVKGIAIPPHRLSDARCNFVATPQLRLVLNDDGLARIVPAIESAFGGEPADVIAIDPIRNVFDGGGDGGENDNAAMLFFLSERVERLRAAVNPDAGVILTHHTKKLGKKPFEEDPFQALAGAGALRGYYTTGMMLYRPDETLTPRLLIHELRNGQAIPQKHVDKVNGAWREVTPGQRLVMKEHGQRLDAERRRKRDVILQMLYDEAQEGRAYTATQFAETFEGQAGLGADRTIRLRISVLTTKGYIKFFDNYRDYGLSAPARSRYGYLCVEGMALRQPETDPDTGAVTEIEVPVLPTHYKCRQSGLALPVEDPNTWIYQEEDDDPERR